MENVKMFLFARWISTCYADEHVDENMRHTSDIEFNNQGVMSVLNREDGYWWAKQLKHFNEVVYPNYELNGSVKSADEFLNQQNQ